LFLALTGWHVGSVVLTDYFIDRLLHVRAFKMPTPSMEPTLMVGDRLVADMRAFSTRAPERGELVVYDGPGSLYIKRVIAVGGDVIEGDGENVILNGQILAEPYLLKDRTIEPAWADDFNLFESVTIPPDSFFVMGDNRRNSYDSRHQPHGLVTRNQVRGKPLYVYWATDKSRIGTKLE
jgi:signal peptidase I